LFCCVLLRELVFSFGRDAISNFIGEGMLIIGWVAMWRSLEIFLHEWGATPSPLPHPGKAVEDTSDRSA